MYAEVPVAIGSRFGLACGLEPGISADSYLGMDGVHTSQKMKPKADMEVGHLVSLPKMMLGRIPEAVLLKQQCSEATSSAEHFSSIQDKPAQTDAMYIQGDYTWQGDCAASNTLQKFRHIVGISTM